jgi:hypothetical protein
MVTIMFVWAHVYFSYMFVWAHVYFNSARNSFFINKLGWRNFFISDYLIFQNSVSN